MFTGIIEELGEIVAIVPSGDGARLTVRAPRAVADAVHGESISVSGVCLTVVGSTSTTFDADVMKQTLDVTALGELAPGSAVNIEKAMRADGRLGGHIVQGHVDGTGQVLEVRPGDQWRVLRVSVPAALAPVIVDKGSITLDGTSLTVSAVSAADVADDEHWFEVSLIPETLTATTLGEFTPGRRVNIETDVLARHVERLLAFRIAPDSPASGPNPVESIAVFSEGGSR